MGRPRIAPPVVKGRRGAVPGRRRNDLSRDVLEAMQSPEGGWGPAMAALDDRRRAFVLAMYEVPRGFGAATAAARMAGFGTAQSSALSMAVKASKLMHDPRVLEALQEEDKRRIKACAPRAIRALEMLVEDPTHKGHERALTEILARVHPIETRHTVDVVHHVDHDAEAVAQLRTLKSLGVVRDKLVEIFGFSGLGRYERMLALEEGKKGGTTIDGTAVEIEEGS
jgi:phage terminase small subunit